MTVEKVRDITDLSTGALQCHATRGHAWNAQLTHAVTVERRQAYEVLWDCARCPVSKVEVWSKKTGQLVSRTYEYGDGYLLSRDAIGDTDTRTLRGEMRLELFGRLASNGHRRRNGHG